MANPAGKTLDSGNISGTATASSSPMPARFPSAANGAGFKPLADWVHAQGLKFGIHIVRGIPRQVVAANLPIAGSASTPPTRPTPHLPVRGTKATGASKTTPPARPTTTPCSSSTPPGASTSSRSTASPTNPYRPTEIRQIAEAIHKTGRPIVLSLSPGPTALDNAAEVAKYAQMWRISNDHWDGWTFHAQPSERISLRPARRLRPPRAVVTYTGPGNWPDADMLPEGWLGPTPAGARRASPASPPTSSAPNSRSGAVARSPLIFGGNLTRLDDSPARSSPIKPLIFIDQNSSYSHPVDPSTLGPGFENARVWRATIAEPGDRGYAEYFAFFNLADNPVTLRTTWKQLGLDGASTPRAMSGTIPPPRTQRKSASRSRPMAAPCSSCTRPITA